MKYLLTFTCRICGRTIKQVLHSGEGWPTACEECIKNTVRPLVDAQGRVISTGHNPGGLH